MKNIKTRLFNVFSLCITLIGTMNTTYARDLEDIQQDGRLRHIGIPYANFVNYINKDGLYSANGLDIELMEGFAEYIGVNYEFIPSNWATAFGQLTGKEAVFRNHQIEYGNQVGISGDVIANGVTILPWREELVDFSDDYFPSAVWLISRSDSDLHPIKPSDNTEKDIENVKELMANRNILAMEQTCLDPNLYDLDKTGANFILPEKEMKLNEMIPAILNAPEIANNSLLDVPDTLIAMEKWPGEIKVIGPVSNTQRMAAGFRKNSPKLRLAFNEYLKQIRRNGRYQQMVEKYYPSVVYFFSDYFASKEQ